MCVKLPPGDLNPGPYPPHSTSNHIPQASTYTYEVTIALRRCGDCSLNFELQRFKPHIYVSILQLNFLL